MPVTLMFFFFQGVFTTVFDPSQKKKRNKSKLDPQGTCFEAVCNFRVQRSGSVKILGKLCLVFKYLFCRQ